MQYTNKNLYRILEEIAEKELELNPIEFIRKEALSSNHRAGEEFYSFESEKLIDIIAQEDEEDELDNEYHEEEYAVGTRFTKYQSKAAFGLEEEKIEDQNRLLLLRSANPMDNPHLVEELEEVFHDANDYMAESIKHTKMSQKGDSSFKYNGDLFQYQQNHDINLDEEIKGGEPNDPLEREVLPYFKDPKLKISIWTIIKDSIGKDITKMSVPVYFNDPTNILQKCASSMAYNEIIDFAIEQTDSIRRLAVIAVYSTTLLTVIEKNVTKPFNPLLGETFEMVTPGFKFIAEQVSHHPPITAFEC